MASTRRGLLAAGGASVLALIAGCSSFGTANDDRTRPTATVRLVGPDADRPLFRSTDVATVGEIRERDGAFGLPVDLASDAASRVTDRFRSMGVVDDPGAFDVVVAEGNRAVTRFGVSPGLASAVAGGDWDGEFRMTFDRRSNARAVQETFACGAESAPVACDGG